MGKAILSAVKLHDLSRVVSTANGNAQRTTAQKRPPRLPNSVAVPPTKPRKMETSDESKEEGETDKCRMPLSRVVADCANRWFIDTLKEAKGGDASMQLLVAQMYYSGYGVTKDPQKGNAWINRASRGQNSVWKGCDKHIGYRTSDSDSFALEDNAFCELPVQ